MKAILFTSILSLMSFAAQAGSLIPATTDASLDVLERVESVQASYNEKTETRAKVFGLVEGETDNATRMVLVLNDQGNGVVKTYRLPEGIVSVQSLKFLSENVIQISAIQDSFTGDGEKHSQVVRDFKVQILRNDKDQLSSKIGWQ